MARRSRIDRRGEHPRPCGRELDREGQALEPLDDAPDGGEVRVPADGIGADEARPVEEQLDTRRPRRAADGVFAFARDPQPLATRDEDAQPGRETEELGDVGRRLGQELFEVVEDEQRDERLEVCLERPHDRDARLLGDRRGPSRSCPGRGRDRGPERGRRTRSRPGSGPRPPPRGAGRGASCPCRRARSRVSRRVSPRVRRERVELVLAPDEVGRRRRQVGRGVDRPQRRARRRRRRHDEPVERQRDLEILEAPRADLDEPRPVGQPAVERRDGRLGDDDLAAIARPPRPARRSGRRCRRSPPLGRGQPALARVDADPHSRRRLVLVVAEISASARDEAPRPPRRPATDRRRRRRRRRPRA